MVINTPDRSDLINTTVRANLSREVKKTKTFSQFIVPRCGHYFEPPPTTNVLHVTGGVYKGAFLNGLKDGFGVMKFRADSAYEGQWKSNRFHGKGTYLWADGRIYQGEHTSLFFTPLFFLPIISCTICCVNFFSSLSCPSIFLIVPYKILLFCLSIKGYCDGAVLVYL